MNAVRKQVRTTLRIPGNWEHPAELVERLPHEFHFTAEALVLPDGSSVKCAPIQPDDQFATIFRSSCRRPATAEELDIVDNFTVNIALMGPGGSLKAALTMMQAGAAIIQAGGAGVFIDNMRWLTAAATGSRWPRTAARMP